MISHILNKNGFQAFVIKVHPEQTYFPKIQSRIMDNGYMVSNPIHLMSPSLDPQINEFVFKYVEIDKSE